MSQSIASDRGETRADDLLRHDNHDLWSHVRLMAVARDPVLSWEEIAARVGVDSVPELLAWFLAYRLPPSSAKLHHPMGEPATSRKAEYTRLQEREASLVTMACEAPRQLITVQMQMRDIERRGVRGVALRSAGA